MEERIIDISLRMTQAHQAHHSAHPAIREAMVLKALYPDVLLPLRENDVIAGRIGATHGAWIPLDFNPQKNNQIGYMMSIPQMRRLQEEYPARSAEIEEMIAYWKKESTFVKIREQMPDEVRKYLFPRGTALDAEGFLRAGVPGQKKGSGFISGSYDTRIGGLMADYRKLMRLGIPGLRAEIIRAQAHNPGHEDFYQALHMALDIVVSCCEHYAAQAEQLARNTQNEETRAQMQEIARILRKLIVSAPETLREGMQLTALFIVLNRGENHGRMDTYLGGLLARDMERGLLDEEGAVQLTMAFWDFIEENGQKWDTRVLIGGMGRENEAQADRFALIAMEATRRRHSVMPVLTLRLHQAQNPALFDKALQMISEGCIYPTLYNDDAYVPGCMEIMHIPYEDAVKYAPLGCGELLLECASTGSPNSTMRMLKALEVTLHNGRDGADDVMIGIETGEIEGFETYEQLEDAFFRQMRAAFERDVQIHLWNREISRRDVGLIMQSLLMEDCIARGQGILDGGIRYFGANVEGFGMTNLANSLAVIKKLVYDEKAYTLRQLVDILDVDFEGHEEDRARFMRVEKYGNNQPLVDDIKLRLEQTINRMADEVGQAHGLHYYTLASVNPGGITIGPKVAASADGRGCGEPMALGNSPTPGSDISGLTAMLLSAAKTDACNGGVVTNMNISRETIDQNRDQVKSIFETYFELGGLQLNINCFSRGDLEKAMEHPELYPNLIVRVSGYSARFIDLDAITQKHIMERTLF